MRKAFPVGLFQTLVHDQFKGASVIDLAHWIFVGHLGGLYKVASTQLHAVDAADARSLVYQTFHVVNGFGTTCTAVSASAGGVGEDASEMIVNGLYVIDAALDPGTNQHLNGQTRHGGIGAHVGQRVNFQAQNFAVCCQGQRRLGFNVTAM